MILLDVRDLGKAYRFYSSEFRRVMSWFGLSVKPSQETWVLRNINFSVKAGEAIGIVGQNGAGKSTLLKIITGTLAPSTGSIHCNGRIAAILELGMGFNPDLTGRQNVYHSAGLMGFSQNDIDKTIDQIESFAEIGSYFDDPVRTYSSGMQMRVAFSVATAFRPEILIVDEALSVGDTYFQHKSFERIREFQRQGTTLLIVSHDKGSIQSLCTRAILLKDGTILKDGEPEPVMDYYNALIAEKETTSLRLNTLSNGRQQTISGSGEVKIDSIILLNSKGYSSDTLSVGETAKIIVKAYVESPVPELVVGYMIKDRLGQAIFGTNTSYLNKPLYELKTGEVIEFEFKFQVNIGPGGYSVAVALHASDTHVNANYEWRDLALVFNVINVNEPSFVGLNWMPPTVECKR